MASAALASCLCLQFCRQPNWTLLIRVATCAAATVLCWALTFGLLGGDWTVRGLMLGSPPEFISPRRDQVPDRLRGAGPWGDLRWTSIAISPPSEQIDLYSAETRLPWLFPNATLEHLQQLLSSAGVTPEQARQILSAAQRDDGINGYAVPVSDETIMDLDETARARIYNLLGLFTANPGHNSAFRYPGESIDQWLAGSGVSVPVLKQIKRLSYRHNNMVYFADLALVLNRMPDRQERTRLVKALARQKTLLLELHVSQNSNIDALVNYWGRGRRSKDVRPIIESLAEVPGGGRIDVAHLLPGFARRRLYTYPSPKPNDQPPYLHDCAWTALNFFAEVPDDRLGEVAAQSAELRDHYVRIHDNPMMGDVVVFSDQGGALFHLAVYIADDILFTKNGPGYSQPWMFVAMDEMKNFYPRPGPIHISYFRHETL